MIQARLATATDDVRRLAWMFLHTDGVIDAELGPLQVRYIDAVDLRRPDLPPHPPARGAPGASDDNGAVQALRILTRNLRTP